MNAPTTVQLTATAAQRVGGYVAADLSIHHSMDDLRAHLPKRAVDIKSAAYRRGYWDGLLTARCAMVLGVCPNVETNRESILSIVAEERRRRAATDRA